MLLKRWEEIPFYIKNDEVKKYYNHLRKKRISLILKRLFDIIMGCSLIVVLSPVFIVIAILIKLDSKGNIFYRQQRVTQYGNEFYIIKFRTMVAGADKKGALVTSKEDVRITKIGCKIRKSRLDELPQLINVIKGEMSFVGTRPEVKKYVDLYDEKMKATLLLPAGITSTASILFKDEDEILKQHENSNKSIDEIYQNIILPKKMRYNYSYLEGFSFLKDIIICIKTVVKT